MTTAAALIQAGYARSTANDPGKLADDAELLTRLNSVYQRLYALAARQRPDAFGVQRALPLTSAPARVALPVDYVEVSSLANAAGDTVHLIPQRERTRLWHVAPSVYQVGNMLISRGMPGDPVAGDVLTATLLVSGVAIVALTTVLDLPFPTRHHVLLSNDVGIYLDTKDDSRGSGQFAKLAADQGAAMAAFAAEYDLSASALEFVHADSVRVPAKSGGA